MLKLGGFMDGLLMTNKIMEVMMNNEKDNNQGPIDINHPTRQQTLNKKTSISTMPKILEQKEKLQGSILIVDDEEDLRELLSEYLEDFGLETQTAKTGNEALQKIKNEHFDIVVTDLQMPGMTGGELIKEIKKLSLPHPKILLLTGHILLTSQRPDEQNALSLSDAQLLKPFSNNEIYSILSRFLGQ